MQKIEKHVPLVIHRDGRRYIRCSCKVEEGTELDKQEWLSKHEHDLAHPVNGLSRIRLEKDKTVDYYRDSIGMRRAQITLDDFTVPYGETVEIKLRLHMNIAGYLEVEEF